MMAKVKIFFADFWPGFSKTKNIFYDSLSQEYNVELSSQPDFLFYSVFGNKSKQFNCKKIFYTGENKAPNFDECDWALGFDYLSRPNYYRLPLYILYYQNEYYSLINKSIDPNLHKRKFCAFLQSNIKCPNRNRIFKKLSQYKQVDSGGRTMNNIGYYVENKLEWIKNYKFVFAFENEAYRYDTPGHTTEKIVQPMLVNSIPLYWGNPLIHLEFNPKSFVNYYDFKNEQEMVDYIIELDKDDDKYMEKLKQPWLFEIPEQNKIENIKAFLCGIISDLH